MRAVEKPLGKQPVQYEYLRMVGGEGGRTYSVSHPMTGFLTGAVETLVYAINKTN
jgi:hypothetical protein